MPDDPRRSELWPAFEVFAANESISLEHEEDWRPWWDCFLAGRDAYVDTLDDERMGDR